jgi:uncharacterized membrane protein
LKLQLPWRYGLFLGLCLSAAVFQLWRPWYQSIMLGFDIAALGYAATLPAVFKLKTAGIRGQAVRNDADAVTLLLITGIISATIMAAVTAELLQKTDRSPATIALCVATLALAWIFSNMVYAIHYAHLYYDQKTGKDRKGINFPSCPEPHYWDFVYFSFTLGMTFQTSDVTITNTQIRKIVTFQSLAAFIFNIGVIAFSINILAS